MKFLFIISQNERTESRKKHEAWVNAINNKKLDNLIKNTHFYNN